MLVYVTLLAFVSLVLIFVADEPLFEHLCQSDSVGYRSLNTSALLCDCKMEWFAHWLRETGFQGSVSVKCAHPQLLRGVSLMEVQQFKCGKLSVVQK